MDYTSNTPLLNGKNPSRCEIDGRVISHQQRETWTSNYSFSPMEHVLFFVAALLVILGADARGFLAMRGGHKHMHKPGAEVKRLAHYHSGHQTVLGISDVNFKTCVKSSCGYDIRECN